MRIDILTWSASRIAPEYWRGLPRTLMILVYLQLEMRGKFIWYRIAEFQLLDLMWCDSTPSRMAFPKANINFTSGVISKETKWEFCVLAITLQQVSPSYKISETRILSFSTPVAQLVLIPEYSYTIGLRFHPVVFLLLARRVVQIQRVNQSTQTA